MTKQTKIENLTDGLLGATGTLKVILDGLKNGKVNAGENTAALIAMIEEQMNASMEQFYSTTK